jgi:hypothetical protein
MTELLRKILWALVKVAWLITGVLPIYFMLHNEILISLGSYFLVFMPICFFVCGWEGGINYDQA